MTELSTCSPHDVLSRLTYRPGTTFRMKGRCLEVQIQTKDVNDPSKPFSLAMSCEIQYPISERELLAAAVLLIRSIEEHEAREFLRLDGQPLHDAHGSVGRSAVVFGCPLCAEAG